MLKLLPSAKKDIEEEFKKMVKHNPKQTEDEIFSNIDEDGFNQNASEQQNYPGVQRHNQNPCKDNKEPDK